MIGESVFSDDPDTLNLFLKDFTEIVKAQKFKSDFVANVSHELKTPLVSIKGFLETISGHAKDDLEAQKKFIPIMLEQADRMFHLQLLLYPHNLKRQVVELELIAIHFSLYWQF